MVSFNITEIKEETWRAFTRTLPREISINSALKFIIKDWVERVDNDEVNPNILIEEMKKEGDEK